MIPLNVLSAIENYRVFEDIRPDLNKAFKEVYLKLLIGKYLPQNPQQEPELILFCIQNNLSENGLETFLPPDARSLTYLRKILLPEILNLGNSYLKLRALVRFVPYAEDISFIISCIRKEIMAISDPFNHCQALLLTVDLNIFDDALVSEKLKSAVAEHIKEPMHQIKVLLDSYNLYFISEEATVKQILETALKGILNGSERARMVRFLLNSKLPGSVKEFIGQIFSGTNPTGGEYSIAFELYGLQMLLNGRLLQEFKNEEPAKWPPILLHAAISDILDYFSAGAAGVTIEKLWDKLKVNAAEEAVCQLYNASMPEGLELTAQAVESLEPVMNSATPELIFSLLPHLHSPNFRTIVNVEQWLNHPNAVIKNYASLYHAEYFQRVSNSNVDGILNLRLSEDFKTYGRVNLLLSGGITKVKRIIPRKYKLSEFGIDFIKKVSLAGILESRYLFKSSSLKHFLADIEIDSADIIAGMFQDENFSYFFMHSSDFDEHVRKYLTDIIVTAQPYKTIMENTINVVIQNFCENDENKLPVYWELHEALLAKYGNALRAYKFIPNNIFAILEAYEESETKDLDDINRRLDEKMVGIDEIMGKPYEDNKRLIEEGLLRAYGYHYYGSYIFKDKNDIIKFREKYSDEAYEFFIYWFLSFSHDGNDSISDSLSLDIRSEYLLVALSIWSGEKNISILNSHNSNGELYNALSLDVVRNNGASLFAILKLLGHFSRHNLKGVNFLISKLQTTETHTQQAAIQALSNIKSISGDFVELLFEKVKNSDPLVSGMCISILGNYCKDSNTNPELRKSIIARLITLLRGRTAEKGIFRFNSAEGTIENPVKMSYLGKLSDVLLREILDVVDI